MDPVRVGKVGRLINPRGFGGVPTHHIILLRSPGASPRPCLGRSPRRCLRLVHAGMVQTLLLVVLQKRDRNRRGMASAWELLERRTSSGAEHGSTSNSLHEEPDKSAGLAAREATAYAQ